MLTSFFHISNIFSEAFDAHLYFVVPCLSVRSYSLHTCAVVSGGQAGSVHVVIDRHLISGQNEESTLTAVQNLILLCNQR